jgi:DNA replicative helicase MCM subunit Mcm2 (Cdc46/Mcm family)
MGGGKRKYPVRQKYIDESKFVTANKEEESKEITEEEHKKRVELLKSMGLLK